MNHSAERTLIPPFLAQAYRNAQADYQRALSSNAEPRWDYVVLTASNADQAEGFRRQLAMRAARGELPAGTRFVVIPDEGGRRVGSGGATLSVIRHIARLSPGGFEGLRCLVIHSGGDSRRIPQYSAVGKLFSPMPHEWLGRPAALFDELMIAAAPLPKRLQSGMLLLSGDVLPLLNPRLIALEGADAAAISVKAPLDVGTRHGVYLGGARGEAARFLHKRSAAVLRACGAVDANGEVDIDTGALLFGPRVLEALRRLVDTDARYRALVNDTVRLSLYGDLQFPLAAESTLPQFLREAPEGAFSEALAAARRMVWAALRLFRMKLLRLAPARFLHFGTSRELMNCVHRDIEGYAPLGWRAQICADLPAGAAGVNAIAAPGARLGRGCYLESAIVGADAVVGDGALLSHVAVDGVCVPGGVVLHGLRLRDGGCVCRAYGVADDPKADRLFGHPIGEFLRATGIAPAEIWAQEAPRVLWTAALYPVCGDMEAAVRAALNLYALSRGGGNLAAWRNATRQALSAAFTSADLEAVFAWEARLRDYLSPASRRAL